MALFSKFKFIFHYQAMASCINSLSVNPILKPFTSMHPDIFRKLKKKLYKAASNVSVQYSLEKNHQGQRFLTRETLSLAFSREICKVISNFVQEGSYGAFCESLNIVYRRVAVSNDLLLKMFHKPFNFENGETN